MLPRPDVEKERERMSEQYVFLRDIADYLKRTVSGIHVKTRKLGMTPVMVRRDGSGKGALAVTAAEAKLIIASDTKAVEIVRPEDLANL